MLFDSHNHLQSSRFGRDTVDLVRQMLESGVTGCVANATRESDWDAVADLAGQFPGIVFPAFGIHPWFAHTADMDWEQRLRKRLVGNPRATVGEIGVDGWVDSPGMDVQYPVFLKQAEIAAELGRTMTVHCLKAWEDLFRAMDEAKAWPERFLMHSFGGSIEVAERLLQKGAWFSFSGHFLHERKKTTLEVFRKLPEDRILLETDAPDMIPPNRFVVSPLGEHANHPANLAGIAEGFGEIMSKGILERLEENRSQFWNF